MSHGYKPVGGLFPETSIGWYSKHFYVDKKDSGQRFQIQFDGIFRDANIWINGFFLGNNKSGYVGTAYDITDYINYDKNNVVVVRRNLLNCLIKFNTKKILITKHLLLIFVCPL